MPAAARWSGRTAPPAGDGGAGALDSRLLWLIFLVALLARIAVVQQLRDLPSQHALVIDAARYDSEARAILSEGWWPRHVFLQAPLYPYLLAGIYSLFGHSLAAVRWLQALAGALASVLAAVASFRLFAPEPGGAEPPKASREAAWAAGAAGFLAALYTTDLFYAPLLRKTAPLLLLEASAVALLLAPRRRVLTAAAAGLALGLAALLQENLLLLCLPAALAVLVPAANGGDGARQISYRRAAALAVAAILPFAAYVLLNGHLAGGGVQASSTSGLNAYIGNQRGASGTYSPLGSGSQTPEQMSADGQRLAAAWKARDTGRPVAPASLSARETNALFWRETFREIAAAPLSWIGLVAHKVRLSWNDYEIPDGEGLAVGRRASAMLRADPLTFGVLAPLAALGCWSGIRRGGRTRRAVLILTALAATATLAVALFFVFGRFRLAMMPFLYPLAGLGVVELAFGTRSAARTTIVDVAVLASVALFAFVPVYSPAERRVHESAIDFNEGEAGLRWGTQLAQEAIGTAPNPAALAQELQPAIDAAKEAAANFSRAERESPGFAAAGLGWASARLELGNDELIAGRYAAAWSDFLAARQALVEMLADPRLDPELATEAGRMARDLTARGGAALNNLGGQLIERGDLGHAEQVLRRAVELTPKDPASRGNLALCWLQQGMAARRGGAAAAARRWLLASREAFETAGQLAGDRPADLVRYREGARLAASELERPPS